MSVIYPLQDDFTAGEITPRLRGKTRSAVYHQALSHCENFEVTPQGSLEMRGGTQFVAVIPDVDAVLHTFKRAIGDDVIVVVGSDNVTLWNRDGPIFTAGGNLLTDPLFWNGLDDWTTFTGEGGASSVVALPGIGVELTTIRTVGLIFGSEAHQDISIAEPANLHKFKADFVLREPPSGNPTNGAITIALIDNFGNLLAQPIDPSAVHTADYTGGGAPPFNTVVSLEFDFVPNLSTVRFALRTTVNSSQGNGATILVDVMNISATDTTIVPAPFSEPTPSSWLANLRRIQTCQDTAVNRMFFTCFGGDMHELAYDPDLDSWDFAPFLPVTDPTDLWDGDQPYTCTIHQGRLWLGGTPAKPSTLWGSKTWNYDTFGIPVTPVASDPVEYTLASNGAIQWIEGLKFLLIGTDRGEIIGRSTGPVLTGSDFDFPSEQTWGSAPVQPSEVGNQVMYVTTDSARVRALYDGGDRANGYESEDLTIRAEHLARKKIVELIFQQNPNYHLSMLLEDDMIATSTYYPADDVNAFFRNTTDGKIKSITGSDGSAGTALWIAVVRRNALGAEFLSLEVKNAGNVYGRNLDSYVIQGFMDDGMLTGLDHLDGYECGIVLVSSGGDKFTILPSQTPVNGEIQLPDTVAAGTVLVGIPYTATAITLPLEAGTNRAGTAQVQKRRFSEVFLRLYDSGIPKIDGYRPAIRTVDAPMNESQPLFTGDASIELNGWGEGIITIEQDLPLPTNITAIFGKAKGNSV